MRPGIGFLLAHGAKTFKNIANWGLLKHFLNFSQVGGDMSLSLLCACERFLSMCHTHALDILWCLDERTSVACVYCILKSSPSISAWWRHECVMLLSAAALVVSCQGWWIRQAHVLLQATLQLGSPRKLRQSGVGTPWRQRHSRSLVFFFFFFLLNFYAPLPGSRQPTVWHSGFCDVSCCHLGITFRAWVR